jgi:hypothetical protein
MVVDMEDQPMEEMVQMAAMVVPVVVLVGLIMDLLVEQQRQDKDIMEDQMLTILVFHGHREAVAVPEQLVKMLKGQVNQVLEALVWRHQFLASRLLMQVAEVVEPMDLAVEMLARVARVAVEREMGPTLDLTEQLIRVAVAVAVDIPIKMAAPAAPASSSSVLFLLFLRRLFFERATQLAQLFPLPAEQLPTLIPTEQTPAHHQRMPEAIRCILSLQQVVTP